jgi:hypothetical protein
VSEVQCKKQLAKSAFKFCIVILIFMCDSMEFLSQNLDHCDAVTPGLVYFYFIKQGLLLYRLHFDYFYRCNFSRIELTLPLRWEHKLANYYINLPNSSISVNYSQTVVSQGLSTAHRRTFIHKAIVRHYFRPMGPTSPASMQIDSYGSVKP